MDYIDFFNVYFWEREREYAKCTCTSGGGAEREGNKGSKGAPRWQQRAWCRTRTDKPWDHDLSWSQTLTCLTNWAPTEPPRHAYIDFFLNVKPTFHCHSKHHLFFYILFDQFPNVCWGFLHSVLEGYWILVFCFFFSHTMLSGFGVRIVLESYQI